MCSNKRGDRTRSAVNVALGGVWHEVRTHAAFTVGDLCVRCTEEPENLGHILYRCPHWHEEGCRVQLPVDDDTTPACVKLHGLLHASQVPAILTHEAALVHRPGVGTVWTDGSGRHSSDPQHKRFGVGYYTDTQERVWLPLPGLKQSVYRAEFLAVVRALEERQPHSVLSDCNQQADVLANQGTAQHDPLDPDATWLTWADFATKVYHFWRLVGPQLRERPEEEPRARLPAEPAVEPPAAPRRVQDLSEAPFQ
eukprot:2892046-Amphidinium_carterae.3